MVIPSQDQMRTCTPCTFASGLGSVLPYLNCRAYLQCLQALTPQIDPCSTRGLGVHRVHSVIQGRLLAQGARRLLTHAKQTWKRRSYCPSVPSCLAELRRDSKGRSFGVPFASRQ